jgi:hypothetical protein
MTSDDQSGTAATFWDLLEDVSRLQREMGKDMVAWAKAYEAAGEALRNNADTIALMADVGRRGEQFLRNGPPAAARQAMQFFLNPLQAMGGASAAAAPGPFARFWEAWASAIPRDDEGGSPRGQ